MDIEILAEVLQKVSKLTKKPELFLSKRKKCFEDLKSITKLLYDCALSCKIGKDKNLTELVIDNFDLEQIWQQIELQNEIFMNQSIVQVSKILTAKNNELFTKKIDKDKSSNCRAIMEVSQDKSSQKELVDEDKKVLNSINNKNIIPIKRKKSSIVDDKFFKLNELNEFLKKEDKREESKTNHDNIYESDKEEEYINYFENFADESEDDSKALTYNDFFDSPYSDRSDTDNHEVNNYLDIEKESDCEDLINNGSDYGNNESDIENCSDSFNPKKKVKFNLKDNEIFEESGIEEKNHEEEQVVISNNAKSPLESRQDRLKQRINQFEQEALSEKPWQLKGEVSGFNRPQNSLIEEFVEFDVLTRPPPVITEQTTLKLEDIITQRIKDKSWDDVEKKIKPAETPREYKKKLIMNQEKSKESLAQIYENEYVKQRDALTNPELPEEDSKVEPPEHAEIRTRVHELFRKLDALSNFHYTPKMAKPELKVVSNIAAVNMEEVAPVAMSDVTMLAPEEVKTKSHGDLIGKTERTKTDIKRERRMKKLKQKAHVKNKEKQQKLAADNSKHFHLSKRKKKYEDSNLLKKLKSQRNITAIDPSTQKDTKHIKSSAAFFTQLQDEVKSSIKAKNVKSFIMKSKPSLSAIKLKL